MDRQDLFDTLTIRFSDLSHRREVLRMLGTLALAMLVFGAFPWRVQAQAVHDESQLVKGCKLPGQKCSGSADCCAKPDRDPPSAVGQVPGPGCGGQVGSGPGHACDTTSARRRSWRRTMLFARHPSARSRRRGRPYTT
jgi:hypothetical protein